MTIKVRLGLFHIFAIIFTGAFFKTKCWLRIKSLPSCVGLSKHYLYLRRLTLVRLIFLCLFLLSLSLCCFFNKLPQSIPRSVLFICQSEYVQWHHPKTQSIPYQFFELSIEEFEFAPFPDQRNWIRYLFDQLQCELFSLCIGVPYDIPFFVDFFEKCECDHKHTLHWDRLACEA